MKRRRDILLSNIWQKIGRTSAKRGILRLFRNQKGLTTLEFALVSPAVFLLVLGTVEVGLMMFAQNVLEGATFAASRLGKTGFVATDMTREQTIRNIISERGSAIFDMDKLTMTSEVYQQFDQIGQPEPFIDANGNGMRDDNENFTDINGNGVYDEDLSVSGLGNAGDVVVYTVAYPWKISTPMVADLIGENGIINLTARTVVQNEPY